ncbi:hypothetical protein OA101_04020, partial [Alphaproteobacteria bacterium]|nr:hypothetical protein [Alphaproteobacteria bacterium]
WYTDLGGPLSQSEIDDFVAELTANGADTANIELIKEFARGDTGRQILMVNNLDMNENPPSVEGAAAGETADQLIGRYMEHMYPALLKRASHPILVGTVIAPAVDIIGVEGGEQWDRAVLMRYKSRRTLLEIVTNPKFAGKHDFKTAALTKTIAYPIETDIYFSDPRLILGLLLLTFTALLDGRLSRRRMQGN